MKNITNKYKIYVLLILFLITLYLSPILKGFESFNLNIIKNNYDDFNFVLLRNIIFSTISSVLNVYFAFFCAIYIKNIQINSFIGKNLGILFLPIVLGNITIAFIFKIILMDSNLYFNIINGYPLYKFITLLIIQFWEYGTLFIYLFWLNIKNIPSSKWIYSKIINLTLKEEIRDIIIPESKNILILLFLVNFIFSFYEDIKINFLFKASQGTHTEFLNNWIERIYQSNLLINPNFANKEAFKSGIIIFILMILIVILITLILNFIINPISNLEQKIKNNTSENKDANNLLQKSLSIIFIIITIIPILIIPFKIDINLTNQLLILIKPIFFTIIASLLSSLFVIFFTTLSRIAWKNQLKNFNIYSTIFFTMLFLINLIPHICILLSGFNWMTLIGYNSKYSIYFAWIIGHIILSFPILASFLQVTHFRIKNTELDYLNIYKINFINIFFNSFIKRFKLEYILTIIFSFTFIWNESNLNNLLSDFIPSFASNMKILISGRGSNYFKATGYMMISIIISIISILIWKKIIEKTTKSLSE